MDMPQDPGDVELPPLVRADVPDCYFAAWKIVNESTKRQRGYGIRRIRFRRQWWSVPAGFFSQPPLTPLPDSRNIPSAGNSAG